MSTTDKLGTFTNAVRNYCKNLGIEVAVWYDRSKSGNILKMESAPQETIRSLYVKVRNSNRGFWGLTIHQIDRLVGEGKPWDVVLLLDPGEAGYRGTSQQISQLKQGWDSWQGDYKVYEKHIKGKFNRFDTYDAFFSLLFPISTQN